MKTRYRVILGIIIIFMGSVQGFSQEIKSKEQKRIDELIRDLGTRYWDKAAAALEEIGEPAVEPLIEALLHGSGRTPENAAYTLARFKSEKAEEALIRVLKDRKFSWQVRAAAADGLGDIKSKKAEIPLIDAVKNDGGRIRYNAIEALIKIGSTEAADAIIEALKDEGWWIRGAAIRALGEIQSKKAAEPLVQALKDEHFAIPWLAVEALEKINSEEAVSLLISSLKDEDLVVRSTPRKPLSRWLDC